MLVNNAGVLIARPFEELTLEDWDATMATNLRSLYLTTRAVLPGMRRRAGRAPSSTSPASPAGTASSGARAYTASKHAVLGFSRSLMLEVRKDNVRVIAICPGSSTPACSGTSRCSSPITSAFSGPRTSPPASSTP